MKTDYKLFSSVLIDKEPFTSIGATFVVTLLPSTQKMETPF